MDPIVLFIPVLPLTTALSTGEAMAQPVTALRRPRRETLVSCRALEVDRTSLARLLLSSLTRTLLPVMARFLRIRTEAMAFVVRVARACLVRQLKAVELTESILPTEVAVVRVAARLFVPRMVTAMAWASRPLASSVLALAMSAMALLSRLKALLSAIRVARFMSKPVVLVVGNLSASSTPESLWTTVILRLSAILLFPVIPRASMALLILVCIHRWLIIPLQSCRVRRTVTLVPLKPAEVLESLSAQRTSFLLSMLFLLNLLASIPFLIRDPMAQAPVGPRALALSRAPAILCILGSVLRQSGLMVAASVSPGPSKNILFVTIM